MDLRHRDWEVFDWSHLGRGRGQWRDLVSTVMNLRVT
jgi:hypothetical protein